MHVHGNHLMLNLPVETAQAAERKAAAQRAAEARRKLLSQSGDDDDIFTVSEREEGQSSQSGRRQRAVPVRPDAATEDEGESVAGTSMWA